MQCICIVLEKFGHRKIVLQEMYVILAKFASQRSENRKIWVRIRAKILLKFTALIQSEVATMRRLHTRRPTAMTVVHSELRYPHCKPDFYS